MKKRISYHIFAVFTVTITVVFLIFLFYIKSVVERSTIQKAKQEALTANLQKASEVSSWIDGKRNEFKCLAQVPAFKAIDLRQIKPLIENLTESYIEDGKIMEQFAYGGVNEYSGFNWVNAEAILGLILYEDYSLLLNNKLEYVVSDPVYDKEHREMLLFYYPVKGYSNNIEGIFCSAVPAVRLKEIVDRTSILSGKSWIMNKEGTVLTTNQDYFNLKYVNSFEVTKQIQEELKSDSKTYGEFEVVNNQGIDSILFFAEIDGTTDWIFCTLAKKSILTKSIKDVTTGLWFVYLLLLCTAVVSAVFLSRKIKSPVQYLKERMLKVEEGDLKAYYERSSVTEIDSLGSSYNTMLSQIEALMEKNEQEQKQKRKAELSVLQAQIKPHFLYNTLDNIKWMAVEEGNVSISKMISNLSTYFRGVLSNGEEAITLEKEFKHTKAYLEIQKSRYEGMFDYSIEMEDAIREVVVPNILIQPLVENAIYHGIRDGSGYGVICVSAKENNNKIVITVTDTGCGMDQTGLDELKSYIKDGKSSGHYGIGNISERLSYFYGAGSFLSFESEKGQGTTATITIPKELT